MRIATVTRISTAILVSIAVLLAITLFWGLQRLDAAFSMTRDYAALKERVAIDTRRTIEAYLNSGDALQLSAAEQQLQQLLQERIPQLSPQLARMLEPPAQALLEGMTVKFRAAGKLSGDSQGLLLQAERELRDGIDSLADYAVAGAERNQQAAFRYLRLVHEMNQLLVRMATARQRFAESGERAHRDHLLDAVSQLQQRITAVQALPALGVLERAEVDEFQLLMGLEAASESAEEDTVDQVETITSNLAYVAGRYPAELERTVAMTERALNGRQAVNRLVAELEASIEAGQAQVLAFRADTERQVQQWFGVFVAAMLLIAVLMHLFQRRIVLSSLQALGRAIANLAESGRMEMIDVRHPHSELGAIARHFNALIETMQQEQAGKDVQLREVSQSLNVVLKDIDQISSTANETREYILKSKTFTQELNGLALEVDGSSSRVEAFAHETVGFMETSEQDAQAVSEASQATSRAVTEGKRSLQELTAAVDDVTAILEVIHGIAEQTNLLALNAAIESARAGEHGRGFAVVADEVRKLSQKTQSSLTRIEDILGQLRQASVSLQHNIDGIAVASEQQRATATKLLETARTVREHSAESAAFAQQGAQYAKEQLQRVGVFQEAMAEMEAQAEQAEQVISSIQTEVHEKVLFITRSLGLAQPQETAALD